MSPQSSPNRDRVLRIGCHCSQCSPYLFRSAAGEKTKDYRRAFHRINSRPRHGRSKPKGQHAYRRGLVQ